MSLSTVKRRIADHKERMGKGGCKGLSATKPGSLLKKQIPISTQRLRAKLWNELNAVRNTEEQADLLVFNHVHYYTYAGDSRSAAVTCPALQLWTEYGELECEGSIDVGMLKVEITEEGISWEPLLMPLEVVKHSVVEL